VLNGRTEPCDVLDSGVQPPCEGVAAAHERRPWTSISTSAHHLMSATRRLVSWASTAASWSDPREIFDVPEACQKHLLKAESAGRVWVAWSTEMGPMAAWGDYEPRRSGTFHRLFVEWWVSSSGHHALWARADPKRPKEWTFGRGDDSKLR
jgi:hypothetical protein